MLDYQLGEMKGTNGSVLRHEVEARAMELAISISRKIESTAVYKQLIKELPSQRVLLYFQYIIKEEIYPFVRQGCVIQWYKRNGKTIPFHESFVKVPKSGVFILLNECWNFEDIPITLSNQLLINFTNVSLLKKLIRSCSITSIGKLSSSFYRFRKNGYPILPSLKQGIIACHYNQGIVPSRRNDLNWYPESGISPERVLIYFDSNNIDTIVVKSISKEIIQKIENQGFKWVALEKGIIEGGDDHYWHPHEKPKNLFLEKDVAQNKVEKWIVDVANDLLAQVHYWRSFYNDFNVKINYVPEEGFAKNIAQAIAFDIENINSGFLVSKQRSEIYLPHSLYCIGYHPKHIFFVWNKSVGHYFSPNYNQNDVFIITGYANELFRIDEDISNLNICQKLRSGGVNFVVALFDNVCGPNALFSKRGMTEFYKLILQWVISDPTIGLIIKSKKPSVVNGLSTIQPLLRKALESGRCIKMENELGRFPSEASSGADMAIGCGISSALIEAVIGGCKGIHYDMTHLKNHEFYKWGYKKVIFDDIDKMMVSLKRYKENFNNEPELGDWSLHLDELDPFHDGKGGERMGTYMRWLLEAFDSGKNRNEATEYANNLYSEQWGSDKVIKISE